MRARSQKTTLDGITFDSIAEACMYCWLVEAKELGVVEEFELQPHFDFTPKETYFVEKKLKTKTKLVEKTLLQPCGYTADFYLGANKDLHIYPIDPVTLITFAKYLVDVKGSHIPPGAAAMFSKDQKLLYNIHGIYVNKVVVAYDPKKYSAKKCATGFFAINGVPERLPADCYQKCGTKLYAVWSRMFDGLPRLKEVHG